MQLKARKEFTWAHRGVQVETFTAGQVIDTDDTDLIEVATREGWADRMTDKKAPAENKADKPAETKKGKK